MEGAAEASDGIVFATARASTGVVAVVIELRTGVVGQGAGQAPH
jgi:hypothetical protein